MKYMFSTLLTILTICACIAAVPLFGEKPKEVFRVTHDPIIDETEQCFSSSDVKNCDECDDPHHSHNCQILGTGDPKEPKNNFLGSQGTDKPK